MAACPALPPEQRGSYLGPDGLEGHVGETAHPILLVKPSETDAVTELQRPWTDLISQRFWSCQGETPPTPFGVGGVFLATLARET
jgi:hypothetical protein